MNMYLSDVINSSAFPPETPTTYFRFPPPVLFSSIPSPSLQPPPPISCLPSLPPSPLPSAISSIPCRVLLRLSSLCRESCRGNSPSSWRRSRRRAGRRVRRRVGWRRAGRPATRPIGRHCQGLGGRGVPHCRKNIKVNLR